MEDENRIRSFKNKGKDCEEMRRRRVCQTIELRKAKKEDQLLKRRNISLQEDFSSSLQDSNTAMAMSPEEILSGMMSTDENLQYQATQASRQILSLGETVSTDYMIYLGIIPRCLEYLDKIHNPSLVLEACSVLTNITSGTSSQNAAVVQEGALPKLQQLLSSNCISIVEQAVLAIGNIVDESLENRDLVLSHGVLHNLLNLIKPNASLLLLRHTVWVISNLCHNKSPYAEFESVKPALPVLAKLLTYGDKIVLADTCWALSFLTEGGNEKIQAVLDTGLIVDLVMLLYSEENTVLTPALRAVGNIVTGNDHQTDMVINAGALDCMIRLLQHSNHNIVQEAAWTISNITAGTIEQIQKVIDARIIPHLLMVLQNGDHKSQKEAAWAVTNLTSGGKPSQLAQLVKMGALKPMCNLLNSKFAKTIFIILKGLHNILATADRLNEAGKVALMIEECGGLDRLEALQAHNNKQIYEQALNLIENYFPID